MAEKKATALLQVLWQLYADVATRSNLLIDECAHVQHTIIGHLPHTDPAVFGLKPGSDARLWYPTTEAARDGDYYLRPPQERALRSLFISMGGLAQAIEANAETLRESFRRVVEQHHTKGGRSDAIFWFISLRGHILNGTFDYYLKHLQHAQEKIIQLLENVPGALPGPTLMRRWSSGGYGEFLSEYSRKVNTQIQLLLWKYCEPSPTKTFDQWRSDQFLVHTWSHIPTSITTKNRILNKNTSSSKNPGDEAAELTLTTIWSSYFYLEQPVLFPLLYHECAHHYETESIAHLEKTTDSSVRKRRALWFNRPKEAAATLQRLAPFEEGDIYFWSAMVDEYRADIISIAQCGDGYLTALMLQITGLQGEDKSYSDYESAENIRIRLDETGTTKRRILEIQYPSQDLGYFWVARARIALEAYRVIFPDRVKGRNQNPGIDAFEAFLSAWEGSGAIAMAEWAASKEHQTYWEYRVKLNAWVKNVAWDCLHDFAKSLAPYTKKPRVRNDFRLDVALLKVIEKDVNSYAERIFGSTGAPKIAIGRHRRLEDLCAHIRWHMSEPIAVQLHECSENQVSNGSLIFDRWTKTYIDYMCCDGSVAFRLAIEWLAVAQDIIYAAAHLPINPPPTERASLTYLERAFLSQLEDAIKNDLRIDLRSPFPADFKTKQIALAKDPMMVADWPTLQQYIREFLPRMLRQVEAFQGPGDNVGNLTLGVVRPAYIAREEGYCSAFAKTAKYFDALVKRREESIKGAGFQLPDDNRMFVPLFGEYSFAVFQPGFASINKSFHLASHPPSILKSRAVLKVGCRSTPSSCAMSFVRVSQAAFKYRWQWVLLSESLCSTADIYLSSAWEDVIVVTYHETVGGFAGSQKNEGLRQRKWLDIQSSLGLPAVPDTQIDPQPCSSNLDFVARWQGYGLGNVLERTGRYDMTIEWTASTPQNLWQKLSSIPSDEWNGVESLVTSLSTRTQPTSGGVTNQTHEFVSQLILNSERL